MKRELFKENTYKRGFSTLEMLIAMTVFILSISAVVLTSFSNQNILTDSETNRGALNESQKLLEQSQALARKDFKLVNPITEFTDPSGFYTEEVQVVPQPDLFTKLVTAIISWTGEGDREQAVSLSTLVTNFENAVGGDTCSSVLSGDWTAPQKTDFLFRDFITNNTDVGSTYKLTDVDAYKNKLYVTVSNSNEQFGPNSATTATDDSTTGTLTWANPENVTSANDVYTTAVMDGTTVTHYLKANNFGFNIPNGATILGIKVDIEKSKSGGSAGEVRDSQVKIVKSDGTLGLTNKADIATNWPPTDEYVTYGGVSDLWNQSDTINWNYTDINDSDFGVVIAATGSASSDRTASIDHIRITITYLKSFYILDVTNPLSPIFVSGLGNNPSVEAGFNAVAVASNFAYVATDAGPSNGQLQVIDLTATPPKIVATYIVPGVTGSGSEAVGKSIFYSHGYIYLGLTKTNTGPEFNIIDVHDIGIHDPPTIPTPVGTYAVGSDINSIYVKGRFVYLATSLAQEITVLDIIDQTAPVLAGSFDAPDSVGLGHSLDVVGDTLYLGRTVTASNPEFYIADITDPTNIPETPLGTQEISADINGLKIRDYLAFLLTATGAGQGQFEIFNIFNPASITSYASAVPLPNTDDGVASANMDCEGNYFYVISLPNSGGFLDKGSLTVITAP